MFKYRYQSIRNGLVGYWRPSRGPTGNTLIDSVRGNHGVLTNGPTWTPSAGGGNGGYALNFDGTDDYVELPSTTPKPTQLSISAWLNPIALVDTRTLLGYDGGSTAPIRLAAKTAGTVGAQGFYFAVGATSVFLNNTAIVNQFSHLVGTVSNDGIALYINGVLSASNVTPSSVTYGTFGNQLWAIGRNNGVYFQSQCDDFSIFSRALTPNEIQTLYTAGRGGLDQRINATVVRGATVGSTFTASVGFSVGSLSLSSSATFTQPTYTANASLSAKSNVDASSQFTQPSYSASVAATAGGAVLTSDATFVQPSYTASTVATVGATSLLSDATFVQPTYDASASLSSKANVDSAATFTQPVYTASATIQTPASLVGSAAFTAPTYAADAAVTTGPTTLVASAIHAAAVYSASASLTASASASVSATFTSPVYSASVSLTSPATLSSIATFAQPTYSAGVSLAAKANVESTAVFASEAYSVSAVFTTGGATLTAIAGFTDPIVVTGQYLGQVVCYSQTVVCYNNTIRAY